MNRITSFLVVLSFLTIDLSATDLEIKNTRVANRDNVAQTPVSVLFDLKWENAWHNDRNHDAVWVFMKFGGSYNNHVKIAKDGHRILQNRISNFLVHIEVSEDQMGFYIRPTEKYRGPIDLKLQIRIDTTGIKPSRSQLTQLKVNGLEMVYIPQGAFSVGSPDEEAIERAALYESDAQGKSRGSYRIDSEAAIEIGPKAGSLYYWSERALYNGDQEGPIPASFPKGFNSFYIMKYELTQGQYADFLNDLPAAWTSTRSPIGGRDYYKKRGGIRIVDGIYVADTSKRPMNQISFTDGLAYSDWAGLRPITELEFEKSARGTVEASPADFPWGNNNYDQLERYVTEDGELEMANGNKESELKESKRPVFGASFYWVMDLSGSVWEKVITIGNPIGRMFEGSHGDGKLSFGHATNSDWPSSDDEVGGFGYRGGGYYELGTVLSDFNPHSPIGYRYYGAWSGGPRSIAYGYRAGRTAG